MVIFSHLRERFPGTGCMGICRARVWSQNERSQNKMWMLLRAPVLPVPLPLVYGYKETIKYRSLASCCLFFSLLAASVMKQFCRPTNPFQPKLILCQIHSGSDNLLCVPHSVIQSNKSFVDILKMHWKPLNSIYRNWKASSST